jgi:hypothetical protein
MGTSKWRVRVAVACLVIGPLAVLAQFVVTPVPGADASVTETLNAIAAHRTAMRWGLALDVLYLLVIPALLFAGLLAGAARSRLAAVATWLVVMPSIAAVVLLGQDALLYVAALQPDRAAATALVHDFVNNGFVELITFGYLAIHVVAFPLLALALRRARVLPVWLAVAFGAWPILEMGGLAAGARPIAGVGYFLQLLALAYCAASLAPSRAPARVVHAVS